MKVLITTNENENERGIWSVYRRIIIFNSMIDEPPYVRFLHLRSP